MREEGFSLVVLILKKVQFYWDAVATELFHIELHGHHNFHFSCCYRPCSSSTQTLLKIKGRKVSNLIIELATSLSFDAVYKSSNSYIPFNINEHT